MSPTKAKMIVGKAGRPEGWKDILECLVHIINVMHHKIDLLQILCHTLTKTNEDPQFPYAFGEGVEHHIHQPEGVENLDAHPTEGAEESVVDTCPHQGAQRFPSVGQDPSEEEKQTEESERHS